MEVTDVSHLRGGWEVERFLLIPQGSPLPTENRTVPHPKSSLRAMLLSELSQAAELTTVHPGRLRLFGSPYDQPALFLAPLSPPFSKLAVYELLPKLQRDIPRIPRRPPGSILSSGFLHSNPISFYVNHLVTWCWCPNPQVFCDHHTFAVNNLTSTPMSNSDWSIF